MEGKHERGASYPLIPALHIPEPLSIIIGPVLSDICVIVVLVVLVVVVAN